MPVVGPPEARPPAAAVGAAGAAGAAAAGTTAQPETLPRAIVSDQIDDWGRVRDQMPPSTTREVARGAAPPPTAVPMAVTEAAERMQRVPRVIDGVLQLRVSGSRETQRPAAPGRKPLERIQRSLTPRGTRAALIRTQRGRTPGERESWCLLHAKLSRIAAATRDLRRRPSTADRRPQPGQPGRRAAVPRTDLPGRYGGRRPAPRLSPRHTGRSGGHWPRGH